MPDRGYDELAAQQLTFATAGSLGVIGALAVVSAWHHTSAGAGELARAAPIYMLAEGARAARDPGIALSHGAAFISRGDLAITGAFMSPWLVQFGTGGTSMQPARPCTPGGAAGTGCGPKSGGALAMGYQDRVSRVTAVSMASGLAALVYLSIFLVDDPTAPWVFARWR